MTNDETLFGGGEGERATHCGVRAFAVVFSCAALVVPSSLLLDWRGDLDRSLQAFSAPNGKTLLDGSWTASTERWLDRATSGVEAVRGQYNDLVFAAGLHESKQVLRAPDGWLFLRPTIGNRSWFDRLEATRRTILERIRARAAAAGVQISVIVAPDKASVLPSRLPAGVGRSPDRESVYSDFLVELEQAGFEFVLDAKSLLIHHRDTAPHERIYTPGDTHWTLQAVVRVAHGWAEQFGSLAVDLPHASVEPSPMIRVDHVPDLAKMLGLSPNGAAMRQFVEDRLASVAWVREPGPNRVLGEHEGGPTRAEPEAPIALVGDSFAVQGGLPHALAAYTGCVVDASSAKMAAGPLTGIDEMLGRIERGEHPARLIVWELVERSVTEPQPWQSPPAGLR